MANPVVIDIPAGAWTKVATNVLSGTIHKINDVPTKYLQTFRDTGDPAPTTDADGAELFSDTTYATISNKAYIDVYVWAVTRAGKVRVDL